MSNNICTALQRLIELDDNSPSGSDTGYDPQWLNDWYKAIAKARDALAAQPVGEGPADDELLAEAAESPGYERIPLDHEGGAVEAYGSELIAFTRAILAPPAPEPGEVGELVAVLQVEARSEDICSTATVITGAELRRAATLLEKQETRIADLRSALRECGLAVGSLIQKDCSDSFLLHVPEEIRLVMARPVPPAPDVGEEDGDVVIDRWIESRPDWPNDWPAVTQSQLTALVGEALEHWGRPAAPAVVPVPVAERPWEREGWCDKRGRCWYGAPDRPGAIACWDLDFEAATDDTHSLPHHAIPPPQAGEGES